LGGIKEGAKMCAFILAAASALDQAQANLNSLKQGALHHAHHTVFRQLQHRFNQMALCNNQIIAAKELGEIERLFKS
jgi:hypothetical protein